MGDTSQVPEVAAPSAPLDCNSSTGVVAVTLGIASTATVSTREKAMTDPADDDEEETQEQRALRHISAMANGADITKHASDLSNDFTDRFTARIVDWFTRRRHR
jgi:hypothetical protein